MRKIKILVTGGKGYIGTELVKSLSNKGFEFQVMDIKDGQEYDICNYNNFIKFKDADFVVHLAGIVGDPNCKKDIIKTIKTNIIGTDNVLKFCQENYIPLIHASTTSVYGKSKTPEKELKEDDELNPISWYALTKAINEEKIKDELKDYVILRFGTVYGQSNVMRYELVVNTLVKHAIENDKITIFDGKQYRPFTSIQDIVGGIIFSIENFNKLHGSTYNLVGENLSLGELGRLISEYTGCKMSIDGDKEDSRDYQCSSEKLLNCGFKYSNRISDSKESIKEIIENV